MDNNYTLYQAWSMMSILPFKKCIGRLTSIYDNLSVKCKNEMQIKGVHIQSFRISSSCLCRWFIKLSILVSNICIFWSFSTICTLNPSTDLTILSFSVSIELRFDIVFLRPSFWLIRPSFSLACSFCELLKDSDIALFSSDSLSEALIASFNFFSDSAKLFPKKLYYFSV